MVAQACEEAAQGDVVSPANLNGGGQVVIAGSRDAVARAGERAKALGAKRVMPLPRQRAVPLRAHEAGRRRGWRRSCGRCGRTNPRVPIVANVDAEPKRRCGGRDRGARGAGVVRPVRWESVVQRLASEGVTTYVEVGPGTVLERIGRKIHREAAVVSFGTPRGSGGRRGPASACLI